MTSMDLINLSVGVVAFALTAIVCIRHIGWNKFRAEADWANGAVGCIVALVVVFGSGSKTDVSIVAMCFLLSQVSSRLQRKPAAD